MYLPGRKPLLSFAVISQVAFWLVIFAFILYISLLNFNWPNGLYRGVLVFTCHLINFYACYSLLVPGYYEKGRKLTAVAGLLVLLIVLTPARFYIEKQFVSSLHINTPFLTRRRLPGFILIGELSIAVIASLLRLAVSNEQNKSKMAALENLQLQTELRFLKAQMSPHFLFNTINNIYSLTLLKSDKASAALMKLSGLLRYMLYESTHKVLLVKEVEALHAYADLFRLRYEKRLDIHIINEVSRSDIEIEPLLLLPLLENALKHSGMGIHETASIAVKLYIEAGDRLAIHFSNTKALPPLQQEAGGIGLANIQKRLQLLYPGRHTLHIDDTEKIFSITMTIHF